MESNYEIVTQQDLDFKVPFGIMVSGPSQSGKTEFTRDLITVDPFTESFDEIYWFYGQYQSRYNEAIPNADVNYVEGFDTDILDSINSSNTTLVVLDDLMEDLGSNKEASKLFTRGIHHNNLSVVFVLQNIFYQAKQMRNISLNNHYFTLMRNDRDMSQILTLGRQLMPESPKTVVEIYNHATQTPFSHLVIDVHPRTKKILKFRSNIFSDYPTIYKT